MPFKSEKQRRFLHANHPEVAKDWEEKYENAEELPAGHYDTHVRLQRGGKWNAHTVNVRKTDKELIKKFLDQGFRIVKPGEEDEEHPRDSMYLKDDPEALKKALAYHRRNVAELSRKSFADLTDEEYDSLKHSEGELELNEGEEDNEHTFGNIQFEPLGKNHNGAEAFRVYKDGSYVLYATMYGPRNTVTLLADPKEYAGPAAAHLYPASPNDSLALTQFDKKQIPGGLEKVAARLGASEEDNEGMSNLEALISSANEDGELKLDDETAAAEFEINKTQY